MSTRKIDLNVSGGNLKIGNISQGDNGSNSIQSQSIEPESAHVRTKGSTTSSRATDGEGCSILSQFDVFLCHNSDDKPDVRKVNEALRDGGVKTWLDEEQLPLGLPWQDELEKHISEVRCALVFIGSGGLGPWQHMEMRALLDQLMQRQCPVIPVILSSANEVHAPLFLRQLTWVDLRSDFERGIRRLIGEIRSVGAP